MSERFALTLFNAQQGHQCILSAWEWAKPRLLLPEPPRLELDLKPQKRSEAENRLLHAMLGYISKHIEWAGSKRSTEVWKRLLVAAWCRARGEHIEILPALDGHGVDIVFRRTSELTRGECAELIEFIFAWGSHNDIRFPPDPNHIENRAS